jgi:RNA polymerase sigma-70 factor (ECF subfamily)
MTSGQGPDDSSLVLATQADPQAFADLYKRYLERVYRYCYLRLRSHEAAEDVTSEVFLKALAGVGGFHGDVFAAWLFRICHHAVADANRRRHPSEPLVVGHDPPDRAPTPEEEAVASDERERLRAALGALPCEQRLVLELQLAGWTGDQMAAVLGKSGGAVRMLRFRAVARLREILRDCDPRAREAHDA